MFQANAFQINAFQIGARSAPAVDVEETRGKGGWDPYYYRKRNRKHTSQRHIVEFVEEVAVPQLAQAPLEVQQQAKEALDASRLAIEKATVEYQKRALREIEEFYSLLRTEVDRRREEEEDDDLLLLL